MLNDSVAAFKCKINKVRFYEGVLKEFTPPMEYTSVSTYSRNEVGEAGELMYFNYLSLILDQSVCSIDWVNKNQESGEPYDFKIKIGSELFYVDVKATKGRFTNDVFLSKREHLFATTTPNYYVARLYEWETDKGKLKAGNFNVKLTTLDKLTDLIKFN